MYSNAIIRRFGTIWILMVIIILAQTTEKGSRQLQQKNRNGPVYTFAKTDQQANIKWGVRLYLPRETRAGTSDQRNLVNTSTNSNGVK